MSFEGKVPTGDIAVPSPAPKSLALAHVELTDSQKASSGHSWAVAGHPHRFNQSKSRLSTNKNSCNSQNCSLITGEQMCLLPAYVNWLDIIDISLIPCE